MRPSAHRLCINETATFSVFLVRDRSVKDGCEVNDREDGLSVSPHMWETHVADLEHNSTTKNQDKAFDTVRKITVEPETVENFENQDGDTWDRKAVTHFVVCSKHHSHILRQGKGRDRPDRVYVTVGWRTNEENEGDIQIPSIDPLKWMKKTKIQEHGNESVTASQDDIPRMKQNVMQDVVEGIGALRVDDYEKNPVQVRVSHPEKVKHDFFRRTNQDELGLVSEQSSVVAYPAVVPVDVLVKNVSDGVLDIAFAAPTEGGVADGERGRYWTGHASMSLRSIAPGVERTICLTAVLISPGQYNMCRFTMLYQKSSFVPNRRRQHISVSPSYMTVEAVGEYKLCEDDMAEEQHETAPLRRSSRRISTGSSGMSLNQSNPKRLSPGPNEDITTGSKHSEEDKTLGHGAVTEASRASERSGRGGQRESTLRDVSPARSGRGTSREGKSAQLLSELKNDAFWNDADTDED
ncbi:hypothetical protein FGB62_241g04 [Gracilaria domingensis]|nr:hypothetical protein FGB62_241g04 [Gracilaria domingensis]